MKKFYVIEDFIDITSNSFALKGTSPLDAEATEVTIASSANVLTEIETQFGERSIYVKETETPFTDFTAMWTRWLSRRGNQIAAAWQALTAQYNPLENYNRTETHEGSEDLTHGEVVTHGGTDNRAITPAGDTVTTTPGITTTVTITPAETTKEISPAEVTTTITPAETTTTITPAETTTTITPAATTNTITPAQTTKDTESSKIQGANVSKSADSSIYAFNSSTAVKVSEGTETDSGKVTEVNTTQNAGSEVLTVQTAGSEAITMQTAGSEAITMQTAGSEAITMQTAGSEVNTTQTAGSEVTGYTGHDTVQTTHTAGSDNRTVNLSDTHSGKDTTETDLEIHAYGNIGTVSSQNMLMQEIEARKNDFVYHCILEFINLYTVYA